MCTRLTPLNSSFLLLAAIGLLACRTSSNERITAPTAPFADDVVGEIEPLGLDPLDPGGESEELPDPGLPDDCDPPALVSAWPVSGPAGSSVQLRGRHLFHQDGSPALIFFETTPATVFNAIWDFPVVYQDTLLVRVPEGFPAGTAVRVIATNGCGSDRWPEPFVYTD
ncbi:MAG: hypothetical protein AAF533_05210 [Acidobacteriota bacterium]